MKQINLSKGNNYGILQVFWAGKEDASVAEGAVNCPTCANSLQLPRKAFPAALIPTQAAFMQEVPQNRGGVHNKKTCSFF